MKLKQKQSKLKLFFAIEQIKGILIILVAAFIFYIPSVLGKSSFLLEKMGVTDLTNEPLSKFETYIYGVGILLLGCLAILVIVMFLFLLKELLIQMLVAVEKIKLIEPYSKLPLTLEEVKDNKLDLYKYLELILKSSTYDMSKYKISYYYSGHILTEEVCNELVKVLLEYFYDDLFSENNKELLHLLEKYEENMLANNLIYFINDYNESSKKNCYKDPLFVKDDDKYVYYESFDKNDNWSFKIYKIGDEFKFEEY